MVFCTKGFTKRVVLNPTVSNTFHMHNSIMSGHLSEKKTREKLLHRCYWYNLQNDVQQWVKMCLECQANKKSPIEHVQL